MSSAMTSGSAGGTTSFGFNGNVANTPLMAVAIRQAQSESLALTYGIGTGQVNAFVAKVGELAASASVSIDLTSLTDALGNAVSYTNLKAIYIAQITNLDATADGTGLTVGNAGANANGLWFGAATGSAVASLTSMPFCQGSQTGVSVDSTHKLVQIANNDGAKKASYVLLLAGVA